MIKQGHKRQTMVTLGLLFLSLCFGIILASHVVSADDSFVDDFTININVSCTLFNNVGTLHTAEVPNGTYRADIGTTTIKAYCNDTNGFSIYAIGYTGEEYGINTLIGVNNPSNTIATGTATSGETSNWAMKLNAVSGTYTPTILNSYDSYHAVPTTFDKVATYTSATDVGTTMANASGSSLTTTYATYISYTQPADTYVGKVKYTLVHPNDEEIPPFPIASPSGKICYYPNTTSFEGTMGCQEIEHNENNFLLASNYSREGYGFAGWSDVYDYEINPNANFYGASERMFIDNDQFTDDDPGLSLYAVWIESDGYLQNWNGCSGLTHVSYDSINDDLVTSLSNVTALTDQRDDETYAVARLADGNCWMIENLRLENTASHNSDGLLAQGYGSSSTYGNFSGLANPESSNFGDLTTNSLYYVNTQSGTASINIGSTDYPIMRFPRYNNSNTQNRAVNPTDNECNYDTSNGCMYSYGNYYSWPAAIANTAYYSSSSSIDANGKTSETVNTSICPSGWRLPYGSNTGNGATSGGFSYLDIAMGGDGDPTGTSVMAWGWRKFPNNFVASGAITDSQLMRGLGVYQTSTSYDYKFSYSLDIDSGVYPGTGWNNKFDGATIRCVLLNT